MAEPRLGVPDLGVGIGLRVPHYREILAERPHVDFFEIISENFMVAGGKPRYHLDRVLESYRVVQHGVSLGIGAPEPASRDYVDRLAELTRHAKSGWVSDHFCWSGAGGAHLHDLLPLPYTEEAVRVVVDRAKRLQDRLGVRFALENTSSYMAFTSSTMTEWEFVSEIAERADIGLLFDVNNVYVSAYNHGFDPHAFVRGVPHERIVQIHLAGHTNLGKYIIDTHRGPVIDPVWDLYRETIRLAGPVSTLVEWDDEIPELSVVLAEAEKARSVRNEGLALRGAAATRGRALEEAAPGHAASPAPRSIANEGDFPGGARPWAQGGPREAAGTEASEAAE